MVRKSLTLAVRAVIARRSYKVLLLQRTDSRTHGPGLWEVPGGMIQSGEPIVVALKREIKEETGLIIYPRSAEPLTFVSPASSEDRLVELIFRCKRVRGEKVKLSPEHQAFRWTTVEAALDLKLTPTARELMEFLLE